MESTVAVVRCADYRRSTVDEAVGRLLALCGAAPLPGGLLLKPNMLSARDPDAGVTTHPAVVAALARVAGPGALIGDSPANSRRPVDECWERCGYAAVAAATGARLVRFNQARLIRVPVGRATVEVPVAEQAFTHPVLNLPRLKTHNLTVLTAAVKNLYGLIPGYSKSLLHSRFMGVDDFARLLAGFYLRLRERVCFNIIDAVTIMDGDGPANGRVRPAGYLVGGRDAAACDLVAADLLGLEAAKLPLVRALARHEGALPRPRVVGDPFRAPADFRPPASLDLVRLLSRPGMSVFSRALGRCFRITPAISPVACRRCGRCRDVCPAGAIGGRYKVQPGRCVNCLCCFEVCPHGAVALRKSLAARFFT